MASPTPDAWRVRNVSRRRRKSTINRTHPAGPTAAWVTRVVWVDRRARRRLQAIGAVPVGTDRLETDLPLRVHRCCSTPDDPGGDLDLRAGQRLHARRPVQPVRRGSELGGGIRAQGDGRNASTRHPGSHESLRTSLCPTSETHSGTRTCESLRIGPDRYRAQARQLASRPQTQLVFVL